MYYQDMSPYSYYLNFSIQEVRNVGWLGGKNDFQKGTIEVSVFEKLHRILVKTDLVNAHVNVIRGAHPCNICGEEDIVLRNEKDIFLGRSELWVPSEKDGEYFAAPTMILHYIKDHDYLPPAEFISAIENFSFDSFYSAQEIYLELVSRYGYAG